MRHALDELKLKGSILVLRGGKTYLSYANDNQADTSYLINSVQKSMTAAMFMRLVQAGKLSLNSNLHRFYPALPGSRQVRIKNLLNMTSGLSLQKGQSLGTAKFISDQANLKKDLRSTVFNAKDLGHWHYTAINYVLLCGILSKLSHKSYEQLFRQIYIKPLKLRHTEFLWSSKAKLRASHWVEGHVKKHGRYQRVPLAQAVKDAHNELGAGSIVMSNHDLAVTIKAILTSNLLSSNSRRQLFRGHAPNYYNGGFYNLPLYKAANGAGEGYYTFLRVTPNGKDMIIVQANKTKKGQFVRVKKKIDQVMALLLRLRKTRSLFAFAKQINF